MKKKKIAFYMCGNFARVLRHCTEYLEEFELHAFCPNKKAYDICIQDGRFQKVEYLFESLNDVFNSISEDELAKTYPEINISRILFVDKSHYKKYPGKYQLKVINAMGMIMDSWFKKVKPDYLFFPIIESVDSMLACKIATLCKCTPMIYTHARHLHVSFLSHSESETLPPFTDSVQIGQADKKNAIQLLSTFRKNPKSLNYEYLKPDTCSVHDDVKIDTALKRLIQNVQLKLGYEKHNQTLQLWIKLQVFLQRLLIPLHMFKYLIVQKFLIDTSYDTAQEYDYFPLHFSPESSINTPAPFYIDQERVVDQILLTRRGNRQLVLKEHPAVAGYRPIRFYMTMGKKPYVIFAPIKSNSIELVTRAETTYSVTGTACLEAFLLGKQFKQFGLNMLSAWCEHRENVGKEQEPIEFIEDVLKVSGDYFLCSPKTQPEHNALLFSNRNISAMCKNIKFYIAQTE